MKGNRMKSGRFGGWDCGRMGGLYVHDSETLHMDENSIWIGFYAEKRGKRESCEREEGRGKERARLDGVSRLKSL